jgi:hypothetical protein
MTFDFSKKLYAIWQEGSNRSVMDALSIGLFDVAFQKLTAIFEFIKVTLQQIIGRKHYFDAEAGTPPIKKNTIATYCSFKASSHTHKTSCMIGILKPPVTHIRLFLYALRINTYSSVFKYKMF